MRNLRKNTGGYALLYVMVVIILLCAVAMMVCTVAMQNLQAQQKSVEQMEKRYEVQGEAERIIVQIPSVIGRPSGPVEKTSSSITDTDKAAAKAAAIDGAKTAAKEEYIAKIKGFDKDLEPDNDNLSVEITIGTITEGSVDENNAIKCDTTVAIVAREIDGVTVKAEVNLTFSVTVSTVETPNGETNVTYSSTGEAKTINSALISYTIENGGGE